MTALQAARALADDLAGIFGGRLQAVAVFEGPPETKERLNVNLPKMLTIDCRRGLDEAALSKFLNGLGA